MTYSATTSVDPKRIKMPVGGTAVVRASAHSALKPKRLPVVEQQPCEACRWNAGYWCRMPGVEHTTTSGSGTLKFMGTTACRFEITEAGQALVIAAEVDAEFPDPDIGDAELPVPTPYDDNALPVIFQARNRSRSLWFGMGAALAYCLAGCS